MLVFLLLAAMGVLAQRGVTLRYGESVSARLTASTPVAFYQFDGTAGDSINARVTAISDLSPRLSLLDVNLSALAFSSNSATGSESAREARLVASLPSSGRYTLVVTSSSGATGEYRISLSAGMPASPPPSATATATTAQFLPPLLQTATAWALGTVPAFPTTNPAALTLAAELEQVGSAIGTAMAETASPTPYCAPNSILPCNFPTFTPTSTPSPTSLLNVPAEIGPGDNPGNPGALCLNGTCTPTPTPAPPPLQLAAASLLSPADGSVVSAQPATLSWPAVPGASYYLVTIGICINLSVECTASTVAELRHMMTAAPSLLVYWGEPRHIRWQVSAFFDSYSSTAASLERLAQTAPPDFPVWRQFRAFAAPQVQGPGITSPSYGSMNIASPFTLTWSTSPGADSYHIQYLFCSVAGDDCVSMEHPFVEGTNHLQDCQPGRPRVVASVQAHFWETASLTAFSNPPVLFWCNSPTPTPLLLQMITLAPTATPTATLTPTLSPTPIPVRASATLSLTIPTSTPTHTATPIPPVGSVPGGSIGNPGALCLGGTCTPTPTPVPPPPILLAPVQGAFLTTPPVILSWSAVPGAQSYSLRITSCLLETGECTDPADLELSTSSYALYWAQHRSTNFSSPWYPNPATMEVTWTVRANFGSTTTGYADAQTFRLAEYDSEQNRPALLSPQSGSVQPPPEVTFVWEPVVGATGYEVNRYWCPQPDDNCRTTSRVTVSGSTTRFGVACDSERPYVNFRLQSLYTLTNTRSWYNAGVDNVLCADPTSTPTSSPTPLLLQMITLAPTATPTATLTPTLSPTPIPVRASATLSLTIPTSTPTFTATPFPLVDSVPGGSIGNPGALCVTGTCTPTPTRTPSRTPTPDWPKAQLLSPANNTVINAQPVTLSWSAVPGAEGYTLHIQNLDFGSGTLIETNDTNFTLYWGETTRVRWEVRARFGAGISYSGSREFDMVVEPRPRPFISSPIGGSTNNPSPVLITWSALDGAREYQLQYEFCTISADECVTDGYYDGYIMEDTSFSLTCLSGKPRVQVLVRAVYGSYTFSEYASTLFWCIPPSPTPTATLSPTPSFTPFPQPVVTIGPLNSATPTPTPSSTFLFQQITLAPTATPMATLSPTPFLLQAITLGPTNTPTATLTPTPGASPIPVVTAVGGVTGIELLTPADGAFFAEQPVLLTWTEARDVMSYMVELTRCDAVTGACANEQIQSAMASVPYSVQTSSVVTWRVRAILSTGQTTAFTPPWMFTVNLPTPIPVSTAAGTAGLSQLTPADGSVWTEQPVLLSWTEERDATSYRVELTRCNAVTGVCTIEQIQSATASFSYTVPASSVVTWRVQAIRSSGQATPFTPPWTFTITLPTPIPLATAVILTGLEPLRPAHQAQVSTQPVTLSWTAQSGAPRYELEITVCDMASGDCVTEAPVVTRASYPLSLAGNAEVTWRVRELPGTGRTTEYTALHTFQYTGGRLSPTPSPTASRSG